MTTECISQTVYNELVEYASWQAELVEWRARVDICRQFIQAQPLSSHNIGSDHFGGVAAGCTTTEA